MIKLSLLVLIVIPVVQGILHVLLVEVMHVYRVVVPSGWRRVQGRRLVEVRGCLRPTLRHSILQLLTRRCLAIGLHLVMQATSRVLVLHACHHQAVVELLVGLARMDLPPCVPLRATASLWVWADYRLLCL